MIRISILRKSFSGQIFLNNLSLDIKKVEVVAAKVGYGISTV